MSSNCSIYTHPQQTMSETRMRWVLLLTFVMMVIELVVGHSAHSLALTADGWHMATHIAALGLSVFAYWYARTRALQRGFAFGTGKVSALAGYTSAGLMLFVVLEMAVQSIHRFQHPMVIGFGTAFPVAMAGLAVNVLCAKLLSGAHSRHSESHDYNLRAAYFHVLADALTSLFALSALLLNQYLGWRWVDPTVGLIGAVLILRWSASILRQCARQLMDYEPSARLRERVQGALEAMDDTRVEDLHVWCVGSNQIVCMVSVSATNPKSLEAYKRAALAAAHINHLTVEICQRGASS